MSKTHTHTLCLWVTTRKVITQTKVYSPNSYFTLLSCKRDWLRTLSFRILFRPQKFQLKWGQWILLICKIKNGNQLTDRNRLRIKRLSMPLSDRRLLLTDKFQLQKKTSTTGPNKFFLVKVKAAEIILKSCHLNLNLSSVNSSCLFQMKNKQSKNKDRF